MAGIASIPPVHLTARAIEWIEHATTIYGNGHFYKLPLGLAACSKLGEEPIYAHVGWLCGVEDVRAIYLNQPKAVRYVVKRGLQFKHDLNKQWVESPIRQPTCVDCLILMDKMLENTVKKQGKYIKVVKKHGQTHFMWAAQDNDNGIQKQETRGVAPSEQARRSQTIVKWQRRYTQDQNEDHTIAEVEDSHQTTKRR